MDRRKIKLNEALISKQRQSLEKREATYFAQLCINLFDEVKEQYDIMEDDDMDEGLAINISQHAKTLLKLMDNYTMFMNYSNSDYQLLKKALNFFANTKEYTRPILLVQAGNLNDCIENISDTYELNV